MFNRTMTTQEAIQNATTALANDISSLNERRDGALSVFRQTANELSGINNQLATKMDELSSLAQFISGQLESTQAQIEDNESVRSRILEIIGE